MRDAVRTWRETLRHAAGAWFAADIAVGHAVVASGRHDEQRPPLMYVAEAFAYRVWYGGRARLTLTARSPELRVRDAAASGQFLGTLATLALLIGIHLDPATFELIEHPFARLLPVAEFTRE